MSRQQKQNSADVGRSELSGLVRCGARYRVVIDGWQSGTRHCTKPRGHIGRCGKEEKHKAPNACLQRTP